MYKKVLNNVKRQLKEEGRKNKEKVIKLWNEYQGWRGWPVTADVNYNDTEFLTRVWETRI